jgi:hypothetical protein
MAKRLPPPRIDPIQSGGLRIEAPQDNGRKACLRAVDRTTGEVRWTITLFENPIRPGLEEDAQWKFITSMRRIGDEVLVTAEGGGRYLVDVSGGEVTALPLNGPWSQEVDGIEGRVSVDFDEDFSGVHMAAVYVELRNVRQLMENRGVYVDYDRVKLTISGEGRAVLNPDNGDFDGFMPWPFWAVLPCNSSLRFRISLGGWGIEPKRHGLFLGAFPPNTWQIPAGYPGALYLGAVLPSQPPANTLANLRLRGSAASLRPDDPEPVSELQIRHWLWTGQLNLPPVVLPKEIFAREK